MHAAGASAAGGTRFIACMQKHIQLICVMEKDKADKGAAMTADWRAAQSQLFAAFLAPILRRLIAEALHTPTERTDQAL
jgi:hypothetical protein